MHKDTDAYKFASRVGNGTYLVCMLGLHQIYLPTIRRVVLTKHAYFNESKFRLSRNKSHSINNNIEVSPSAVKRNIETNDNKCTFRNKQKPPSFVNLSNEERSTQGARESDEKEVQQTPPVNLYQEETLFTYVSHLKHLLHTQCRKFLQKISRQWKKLYVKKTL